MPKTSFLASLRSWFKEIAVSVIAGIVVIYVALVLPDKPTPTVSAMNSSVEVDLSFETIVLTVVGFLVNEQDYAVTITNFSVHEDTLGKSFPRRSSDPAFNTGPGGYLFYMLESIQLAGSPWDGAPLSIAARETLEFEFVYRLPLHQCVRRLLFEDARDDELIEVGWWNATQYGNFVRGDENTFHIPLSIPIRDGPLSSGYRQEQLGLVSSDAMSKISRGMSKFCDTEGRYTHVGFLRDQECPNVSGFNQFFCPRVDVTLNAGTAVELKLGVTGNLLDDIE